ncbi:MAG TPA: hypothetical protein VIU82_12580 [Bosea sp. (in: a-proteobacteria)]
MVRSKALTPEEKAGIATLCERLIADSLKPRFLPEIHPTEFNYPVDMTGRWRGAKYCFITRYRSGFADNLGEEFDVAFARLDHLEARMGERRFDVMWHRHTGQWFRRHEAVTLEKALRLIATDELLRPPI